MKRRISGRPHFQMVRRLWSAFWPAAILCALILPLHAQMTANVFRRVLMIRPLGSRSFGTGFTMEVGGRQYLVTAKHVVAGMKASGAIEIREGASWQQKQVKVFLCDDPIDIAVLVPETQLTPALKLEATLASVQYGQDVYFVGFPYGIFTSNQTANGDFPLAFIKKAIMSASTNDHGAVLIFLDGQNNPGFSGGPIVYRDLDNNKELSYKVLGVVSGYRATRAPVLKPVEIDSDDVKPEDLERGRIFRKNGQTYRLTETENLVDLNTGIIEGYGINHALELIQRNPIGPRIDADFK